MRVNMTKSTYAHNYTYLITNITNNMKYIGARSCACLPEDDPYTGSSKSLTAIMVENSDQFIKEILSDFPTRILAVSEEIRLHNLYDVAVNPEYYNKSKQTSIGFDTTGTPVNKGIPKTQESIQKRLITMSAINTDTGLTGIQDAHNKSVAARKKIDPHTGLTGNQIAGLRIRAARSKIDPETGLSLDQSSGIKKRGKNNYLFTGYYITPWGKFATTTLAQTDLVHRKMVAKYCKNSNKVITRNAQSKSKYLKEDDIGKTLHTLGFGFEATVGPPISLSSFCLYRRHNI